jgi:Pectinesterase
MSTFYVKKDGSGTHTAIYSAIYAASSGDIIDIGPGIWNENVEFLNKNLTLQGAGKTQTIIQGKSTNDSFTGCSYYVGETTITVPSSEGFIVGRPLTSNGTVRVASILSPTQITVTAPLVTAGNITKTGVSWSSGVTSITLPSATTGIVAGMKVEALGVPSGTSVVSYNTTTRVLVISNATTQSATNETLLLKKLNSNQTITQFALTASSPFGTVQLTGVTDGVVIKDLQMIGFDLSNPGLEGGTLYITASVAPGHKNLLVDNCRITANGESAIFASGNHFISDSTFQNCLVDGKTFTGEEPAELQAFSYFNVSATIVSATANSTTLQVSSSMVGIVSGCIARSVSSPALFAGSGTVTSVSENTITINKLFSGPVGTEVIFQINSAFTVPNVAENFIFIGSTAVPCNVKNITFRNNILSGQSGAVISATGNKSMFNSALTIDAIDSLIEDNIIDGQFGAGDPNTVFANFAIRARQTGVVVRNNVNKVYGGRGNSGFLVLAGTSENNVTLDKGLISAVQAVAGQPVAIEMSKDMVKAISKVAADPVFSDEANWHLVAFIFKKQGSSKRLVSAFRSFDSEKSMKLRPGMLSGDVFELHKIIVSKADRTLMVVKRAEIDGASSYDFTLA